MRSYTELFEATSLIRENAFSASSNTRSLVSILIFSPGICHCAPSASQDISRKGFINPLLKCRPKATVSSRCLLLKLKNSVVGLKLSPKLHLLSFHLKLHTFCPSCQVISLSRLYPWFLQVMTWVSISFCFPLHVC